MSISRKITAGIATIAAAAAAFAAGTTISQPAHTVPSYSQAFAQCQRTQSFDWCVDFTADAVAVGAVHAPVRVNGEVI